VTLRASVALGFAGLLLALAPALQSTAAPPMAPQEGERTKSVRDGVFSAVQAERGDQIFKERCASCHQPAEFTRPTFMGAWAGQTAEGLFDAIRTTMPTDNPGSLRRQEYADLLAYLFSLNGLPAGDVELRATAGALKQVLIEAPIKPVKSKAGLQ
jgi:mono/diheme cytochrome c family protein